MDQQLEEVFREFLKLLERNGFCERRIGRSEVERLDAIVSHLEAALLIGQAQWRCGRLKAAHRLCEILFQAVEQ